MGVPLFYSWLLKRYPYIKQESNSNIPYIDCLYMDLNCIIYKCVRDESTIIKDFANAKQFDEIWVSIINSIDRIISMVNPRKLLYLTYDGVAPRAKMNQQRNRRFKSGKSQEKLAAELNKYGITQNQETFINNSITPGTKFMHELNGVMLFYINKKILEDPKWRKIKIIYSGSDVPGEGEHKIFDYIRKSTYNPEFDKLIHCVYGNDADLIMLCLGSHLSNMMILREKFVFKKQISKIKVNDETIKYEWVNINIIRDCFQLEYESIKDNLKHITFDINRIIDDFIFICFFIGNDFLPKLFCFDIKKGYFDELIVLFKDFLINTTDHIISAGILNLQSFESLIQRLSNWELKLINVKVDHAKKLVNDKNDIKYSKNLENNNDEKHQDEEFEIVEKSDNYKEEVENLAFLETLYAKYTSNKSEAKSFYYSKKLKLDYSKSNYDKINELISKYIQGIQFVLLYYFKGCPSWVWYYSYYYAPMISDVYEYIKYINEQKIPINHFIRGVPFQPFKQLLLVMPKESIKLLPEQFHKLVLDNNSILKNPIDYFPDEFEIDPNDAYYESDYIALLPFVDEDILNKAFESIDQKTLEIDVLARNNEGNNLQFNYCKKKEEKQKKSKIKYASFSKEICNDIEIICDKIEFNYEEDPPELFTDFFTKNSEISRENNLRDKYEYKLPTLKYFPGIKGKLVNQDKNKMKSMVRLNICSPKVELNEKQMYDLNGKDIYVIYPNEKNYLEYNHGRIAGYMTENEIISYDKSKQFFNLPYDRYSDRDHVKIYRNLVKNIHFELACQGIEFAEDSFNVIFFVDVDLTNKPRKDSFGKTYFKTIELVLPPQLITTSKKCIFFDDIQKSYLNFAEEFPLRNHGIILSNKDNNIIGSIGKIKENVKRKPFLELKLKSLPKQISREKISSILKEPKTTNYYSLEFVANKLEVSLKSILVLCDSILIQLNKDYSQKIGEKIDLGLNIISQNYWNIVPELVICSNYNKLIQQNNNDNSFFENLEISEETLNLMVEYHKIFPELFKCIENSIHKKRKIFNFSSDDIFPGDSEGSLKIIKNFTWLLSQKIMGLKLMPLNSQVLSKKQINMLIEKIDESAEEEKITKELRIVNCNRVILENNNKYFPPKYWDHPQYHEIGDRVINLKTSYSSHYNVPFGKTGTIIGIIDTKIEILFDEPFIGGSNLGGRCPFLRGAILYFTDVFNLMKERKWDLDLIDRPKTKTLKPIKEWNEYIYPYVPVFLEKIIESEKINNKELSNQILKIIKRDQVHEENKNIEKEENKNKESENNNESQI